MTYGDSFHFEQGTLNKLIGMMGETRDAMEQIKQQLLEYNESNLKPYWTTAGSAVAQSRLQGFIDGNITEFIAYITQSLNNLEGTVPYVNQTDQA